MLLMLCLEILFKGVLWRWSFLEYKYLEANRDEYFVVCYLYCREPNVNMNGLLLI
jgi:hypothetical protein